MPANESIKRRVKALVEGRAGYGGFVCVAVRPVYPGGSVPPTEEIFSTPREAKAAAVLREAGRPVPEDRVICLQAVDFKPGAPQPCGWTVGTF